MALSSFFRAPCALLTFVLVYHIKYSLYRVENNQFGSPFVLGVSISVLRLVVLRNFVIFVFVLCAFVKRTRLLRLLLLISLIHPHLLHLFGIL